MQAKYELTGQVIMGGSKKSKETPKEAKDGDKKFRLYDPWEKRFDDDKRRIGTVG